MNTYRLKGASGPIANQIFALGERTIIGRAPDCDVVVDDARVAPHQVEIKCDDSGRLILEQLDAGFATLVNGAPAERLGLVSGDELRLGSYRFVLQAPGLRPEKVLTEVAVRRRVNYLPWLVSTLVLVAALWAWRNGWLPF